MPGQTRYQDKASEFINNINRPIVMAPTQPEAVRPAVARGATRKETRFLLSIIANNVQRLQEGFHWDAVAVHAALKEPSATLAMQAFSDLRASLAVPPLEDDLKEATIEELDIMISCTQQKMTDSGKKFGEMMKEREIKRAMREEQDKLEVEESVLRKKRESLRERTMEGLKRKREEEVVGKKGKGPEEAKEAPLAKAEEDVKVKKEKLDEEYEVAKKERKLDEEDIVGEKNNTAENNVAEKKDGAAQKSDRAEDDMAEKEDEVSEEGALSEFSECSDDDSADWCWF